MIPQLAQLHGTWASECTAAEHTLDGQNCIITFFFDELPFGEDRDIVRVTSTIGKMEKILYTGEYRIEHVALGEFFIIINDNVHIPARQFQEGSFLVDVNDYGRMILIKEI